MSTAISLALTIVLGTQDIMTVVPAFAILSCPIVPYLLGLENC